MSMLDLILKMPLWYLGIMTLFSLFYATRGIMAQKQKLANDNSKSSPFYNLVYWYIQEALFKIIFTMSAFIALLIANHIFASVKSIDDIGAGTALVLIFLIIWGITGISGYLTYLIVSGRLPFVK